MPKGIWSLEVLNLHASRSPSRGSWASSVMIRREPLTIPNLEWTIFSFSPANIIVSSATIHVNVSDYNLYENLFYRMYAKALKKNIGFLVSDLGAIQENLIQETSYIRITRIPEGYSLEVYGNEALGFLANFGFSHPHIAKKDTNIQTRATR